MARTFAVVRLSSAIAVAGLTATGCQLWKGRRIEKWILRRATEDLLPQEIVWRDKAQFDEGSGTVDLLQSAIALVMTPTEAVTYRAAHPEIRLRSSEECFYHQIFTEVFEFSELISANVGRWAERPALE